jgi:hypothetical protein
MEVSLNPSTTVKPQPMSAITPSQFLPPAENGKYPNFAEIYRKQKLQREQEIQKTQAAGQTVNVQPVEQTMEIQSAADVKVNLEILVKTNESVSLQTTMKLDFQRDSNLLARMLNNRQKLSNA